MATTLGFKDIIDLPEWRPIANAPNAATVGVSFASDKRNNEDRHPEIFQLAAATVLNKYSIKNDDWLPLASPALGGTFGAGVASIFVPEFGIWGTLANGTTNNAIISSTTFPAVVGVNQLANRGDGTGFKVRVIGKGAGSSGKAEERTIVGNTSGSAPTIYLGSSLSFTTTSGDAYEILAGKVFLLGAGSTTTGTWRSYNLVTNAYETLNTANLPTNISTDSVLLSLSELYVPNAQVPNEGFLGFLTATSATATTLTGQSSAGDANVLANEYRNFQIRIYEDLTNKTVVGQRRRISSHTAGTSPVYTVPTWSVTPSASAKYVIEDNGDNILLWTTGTNITYNYSNSSNAWTINTWTARPTTMGAGCIAEQAYGATLDANKLLRHSHIFSFRGGSSPALDLFDIANTTSGGWTSAITYGNSGRNYFTTGTVSENDPVTNSGKYFYMNIDGTQRFARFDMLNRVLEPYAFLEYSQGTSVVGDGLTLIAFIDGSTKLSFLTYQRRSNVECFQLAIQR